MVKGSMKYIPKEFIEELEIVKKQNNFRSDADVFRQIKQDSKIGREIRINLSGFGIDLNFNKKKKGGVV